MLARSAPRAVRSWVVVASVWGLTMTTPPWIVGLPSGSGAPEEMQAAMWRARRLLPQPWSPSSRVMPARGSRLCQSQRTG
jgi:hypothetical protein